MSARQKKGGPSNRMPTDAASRRVLHKRALQLARGSEKRDASESRFHFIRVYLGQHGAFHIPKARASEIITSRGMARVPCTPNHFAGVVSLRGEMIAVLDLAAYFGLGKLPLEKEQPLLIITGFGMTLGLLLTDIDYEVRYAAGQLGPAMTAGGIDPRFVAGIHEGRYTVLDLDALLNDPNLVMDK